MATEHEDQKKQWSKALQCAEQIVCARATRCLIVLHSCTPIGRRRPGLKAGRATAARRSASTVQRSPIIAADISQRQSKSISQTLVTSSDGPGFLVRRRIATAFSTRQEIICEFFCCGYVKSCRANLQCSDFWILPTPKRTRWFRCSSSRYTVSPYAENHCGNKYNLHQI